MNCQATKRPPVTLRRAALGGALALSLLLPGAADAAGGSTSNSPSIPEISMARTPEQHYNQGLRHRDKAWELEQKAAAAQGKAAEKLFKKAQKEFEKAARAQREAIEMAPDFHQAHSSLGYALRKLGDFDESIRAYDAALALAPNYTEAIEYRAEAYLGLNRLEEVKEAYLLLVREDQARADELMSAMKRWIEEQQSGGGMSAGDLDAFASWVEERASVAGHLAMLASPDARLW